MKLSRNRLAPIVALEPLLALSRAARAQVQTASLMYHEILPDEDLHDAWTVVRETAFRAQMLYLRERFDILSLDELLRRMREPGRGRRCMAAVTFDDGYKGNRDVVWPLIERLEIPITIFVATGAIEGNTSHWFDRVIAALLSEGAEEIDLRARGLGTYRPGDAGEGEGRWVEIQRALADLKGLPPADLDPAVLDVLRQAGGVQGTLPPLPLLSVPDIQEMARSRFVTFGAHSHGHEVLPLLSHDEVGDSVLKSKKLLEEWTGKSVRHFAYPHGMFTPEIAGIVRECGFDSSQATRPGLWRKGDSDLAVPRVAVGRYDSLALFRMRVSGMPGW